MCAFFTVSISKSPSPPSLLATSSSRDLCYVLEYENWQPKEGQLGHPIVVLEFRNSPIKRATTYRDYQSKTSNWNIFKSVYNSLFKRYYRLKLHPVKMSQTMKSLHDYQIMVLILITLYLKERGMKLSSVWNFLNVWHPYRFKLQWSWRWVNNPWF